ncbi:MAG: hypothetical protein M3N14_06080 [Bacteroidota bacterium]|nr:hypothetical protein [Bacteroidota bacterium]
MEHGHLPQALITFELNTRLYLQSDNVYNGYSDALKESGYKAAAIAMYLKSLAINPKNEDSSKAFTGQLTTKTEQRNISPVDIPTGL